MPYSIDKKNKCVYKKNPDGTREKKVGCTKGSLKDYLGALHMRENGEGTFYMNNKQILSQIKTGKEYQINPKFYLTYENGKINVHSGGFIVNKFNDIDSAMDWVSSSTNENKMSLKSIFKEIKRKDCCKEK